MRLKLFGETSIQLMFSWIAHTGITHGSILSYREGEGKYLSYDQDSPCISHPAQNGPCDIFHVEKLLQYQSEKDSFNGDLSAVGDSAGPR